MRLWLTRRQGDLLQALEEISLDRFGDLFEAGLAREGTPLRLVVQARAQEIQVEGIVLPPHSKLRKSARVGAIKKRVEAELKAYTDHLSAVDIDTARTASARNGLAVLDALSRARRPLTAIVVV